MTRARPIVSILRAFTECACMMYVIMSGSTLPLRMCSTDLVSGEVMVIGGEYEDIR